ncbi:polysaccharide biosynthesis tyrosine autokinase [Sinomonas sp. ASV322]|uniref:polysaccharide biosynthesis tyrosine autokinase n=1 Tax=Sinomonas sp. ASV322 TaxID=3041920 RepID=UPI0027DE8469|nr:polysaccharide biosynthesis tyrosine autokinase [Sinomonas sp. ASV322]MDQ4502974.1 polysaccharide biosynthesis tyrosine autokinase [Sinomonas sp. ASV322]
MGNFVELRDYIRIIRTGWVLIVVMALVGVAAAAGISILMKPQFKASAQVFVSTQSGGSVADLVQGSTFTQQRVKTYAGLVTTPIVLLPVISTLHLSMTADELAKSVTASAPLDTTLIQISAVSSDPVRAAEIANATSESLTNVVQSIESTGSQASQSSQVKLTRVQEAQVPSTPVTPNVPLNLGLGLFLGLALGVGGAVLRHVLDNRVRNEHDIESISPSPVLGGTTFDSKAAKRPLIVQDDPRSPRAEAFRALRTNLQFIDAGGGARSFVITSSIESEGKSSTASNLAIALDNAGHKVVVVDADLRRPKLAEYMGLEGAVGLTDLLIGRAEMDDVLQPWGRGDLHVLPAGSVPPNPSELLGSRAMYALVRRLEQDFDYVLFDAPPLLPVTDAAILSKTAGGAIVVVAAGKTHRGQLGAAVTALENVGARVFGFVLTMLPVQGPHSYGYQAYGYGYGASHAEDEPETVKPERSTARRVRGTVG